MQRLSSGKRINNAGDDSAGMSVVSLLNRQVIGNQQAIRNTEDAVSLVAVTDTALEEMLTIFNRARQLSVYSANATLSATDRTHLDVEFQSLVGGSGEATRLASSTDFNGIKLLANNISVTIQAGWKSSDTLTVTGLDVTNAALNPITNILTQASSQSMLSGGLDLNIDILIGFRASLGASTNRLSHTMSTLQVMVEKTTVARGRIESANYATESTNLAKSQVLQQSGMAMLSASQKNKQELLKMLK